MLGVQSRPNFQESHVSMARNNFLNIAVNIKLLTLNLNYKEKFFVRAVVRATLNLRTPH